MKNPISGHVGCVLILDHNYPDIVPDIGCHDIGTSCFRYLTQRTRYRDPIPDITSGVPISLTGCPDIVVNIGYYRVSGYRGIIASDIVVNTGFDIG